MLGHRMLQVGNSNSVVDGTVTAVGYLDADTTFDGSNPTSATLSFGAADSNRYIFAFVMRFDSGANFTALSIGGVSATEVGTQVGDSNVRVQIFYANVPTGTSGTVTSTTSDVVDDGGVFLVRVVGGSQVHDTAEAISGNDLNLNVDTLDACAVLAGGIRANASNQWTWTGVTEHVDVDIRSGEYCSVGTHLTTSAETPRTVTGSTTNGNEVAGRSIVWK